MVIFAIAVMIILVKTVNMPVVSIVLVKMVGRVSPMGQVTGTGVFVLTDIMESNVKFVRDLCVLILPPLYQL
jgi:uncharacterized PurR-regulated membrane protein YhhQ (DUF165 family)